VSLQHSEQSPQLRPRTTETASPSMFDIDFGASLLW
jgi:hypothetical protein